MLYGDDDYEQGHVVTVLCKVGDGRVVGRW